MQRFSFSGNGSFAFFPCFDRKYFLDDVFLFIPSEHLKRVRRQQVRVPRRQRGPEEDHGHHAQRDEVEGGHGEGVQGKITLKFNFCMHHRENSRCIGQERRAASRQRHESPGVGRRAGEGGAEVGGPGKESDLIQAVLFFETLPLRAVQLWPRRKQGCEALLCRAERVRVEHDQ